MQCRALPENTASRQPTPNPIGEWVEAKKPRGPQGRCLVCAERHVTEPLLLKRCNGRCGEELPQASFSFRMWNKVALAKIKCKQCCKALNDTENGDARECQKCLNLLPRVHFSDGEWRGKNGRRTCRTCTTGPRALKGQWTCCKCKATYDESMFRLWKDAKNTTKSQHCKCNKCWSTECETAMRVRLSNVTHTMRDDNPS